MFRLSIISFLPFIPLAFLFFANAAYAKAQEVNPDYNTAVDAYIYGYSLVLMDVTKEVVTNVAEPTPNARAPINQFSHSISFPTPEDKDVVSPNADTLYSTAWLDLAKEPIILQLPDTQDRYYLMPILDAWSNVIASPGKRTTGTQPNNYAIVGPDWEGELPVDTYEIRSPTNIAWILGRTQTNGKDDYEAVHVLQAQYKLIPLSSWGKDYIPPKVPIDDEQDMSPPVNQVDAMDAETFFNHLAMIMETNPPASADADMIAQLATIGIIPGESYSLEDSDTRYVETINKAVKVAHHKIKTEGPKSWEWENSWLLAPVLGSYGTQYLERATVAMYGLGANLPEDAIYPMVAKDGKGKKLNGRNDYVIHFDKDELPPVNAFWSLTLYDDDRLFVDNELDRYALGDRDSLHYNKDGSLDIYIQHKSPGHNQESNWLPAPKEDFNMIMRLYWPGEEVVRGEWIAPAINPKG